jgi:hypothetical protein
MPEIPARWNTTFVLSSFPFAMAGGPAARLFFSALFFTTTTVFFDFTAGLGITTLLLAFAFGRLGFALITAFRLGFAFTTGFGFSAAVLATAFS